jgi:hypothetical protein
MTDTRDSSTKREPIRVVDRRKFTSDGAPRTSDSSTDDSSTPQPLHSEPGPLHGPVETADLTGSAEAPPQEEPGEDRIASSHFKNLILNLATTAAASLGEIPNPFTQRTETDLEGARQVIELLVSLRVKTRGNLASEEASLLDSMISDLQMKFVSLQAGSSRTS